MTWSISSVTVMCYSDITSTFLNPVKLLDLTSLPSIFITELSQKVREPRSSTWHNSIGNCPQKSSAIVRRGFRVLSAFGPFDSITLAGLYGKPRRRRSHRISAAAASRNGRRERLYWFGRRYSDLLVSSQLCIHRRKNFPGSYNCDASIK